MGARFTAREALPSPSLRADGPCGPAVQASGWRAVRRRAAGHAGRMPGTYTNPVWDGYLADPFVWKQGASWYAVGTGPGGAHDAALGASGSSAGLRIPLLRSSDLVRWELLGEALQPPDPCPGDEFWAPAVAVADGRSYLYYSIGPGHQLRVAVAERPEGPYVDRCALMEPGRMPFAIDPHPFRDEDGTWWLFYARDFLDTEGGHRAGTALAVDRLVDMVRLAGEERVVLRARHEWQRFMADRTMYGKVWDWHTLEGPCVLRHDGRYWCIYSGACYGNPSYGVDYAVADRITGPWSDSGGEPGPRILSTVPGRVLGPGHNCVITDDAGDEWVVYHAWDPGATARRMHIDRLMWTPDGPRCTPTWTPQPAPAVRVQARR